MGRATIGLVLLVFVVYVAFMIARPMPPGTEPVSYYEVDLTLWTDSDWARVTAPGMRYLSWTQHDAEGLTPLCGWDGTRLLLDQSFQDEGDVHPKAVTLRYAVAPGMITRPLTITCERGDWGSSRVTATVRSATGTVGTLGTLHDRLIPDDARNTVSSTLDLAPLLVGQRQEARIARLDIEKRVLAFYYPWYSVEDWESAYLRDTPAIPYNSGDPVAIARHIAQAQGAGIDGFISSWWGPEDMTDHNLARLLDIAEERQFLVTVNFETLAGPDDTALDRQTIVDWLAYLIETYGEHPAFMHYDGRPVVFIWLSFDVPLCTWAEILETLRARELELYAVGYGWTASLDVFDALHEYGLNGYPDMARLYGIVSPHPRHHALVSPGSVPRPWIASTQAGYDDTLLPGRPGYVQPRNGGDYYRSTWEGALSSDPDWVLVTTWNEWWEHTHIEPSVTYSTTYTTITRQYADRWRATDP